MSINQTERYLVKDLDGEELGRYRLKSTCYSEHGAHIEIIDLGQ